LRLHAPTTELDPNYCVDEVTHYGVAHMPDAASITSTYALTDTTVAYILRLAHDGVHAFLTADAGSPAGLNAAAGEVTYAPVARDQAIPFTAPEHALDGLAVAA
jgi:alanine dehydrogenase